MKLTVNRLRKSRMEMGLTQEKLADTVHVSRQTINSIEAGRYVPSLKLALELGQVFNCCVEDLFNFSEVADVR
jgi:putative transcriptional regulator